MMATTIPTLAAARADAAAELEDVIAELGMAYGTYLRLTTQLEAQGHPWLARGVETALQMHLHHAGLAAFLDNKLVSPTSGPPSLRDLVVRQHATAGVS